ncbi:4'-phosphopantetheinyl transferase superfamily protein [Actinoplanes sp. NEAU-A12]|uniref:4'-phosphopantetheinyl transferase superfamily protein n=1 Tax=Actinoplanes sandaracinus TaxID=3045177 RepID=A0ABT6WTN2_9ACTN|nr:4'-phosphopantetheinyl transferase superfamily protein [Actinoplanes sandaracinus]
MGHARRRAAGAHRLAQHSRTLTSGPVSPGNRPGPVHGRHRHRPNRARPLPGPRSGRCPAGLSEQAAQRVLTRFWVGKEAVLKATGDGLRLPMNRLELAGPGIPPAVHRWADRPGAVPLLRLTHLRDEETHQAALAVLDPRTHRVREFTAATRLV